MAGKEGRGGRGHGFSQVLPWSEYKHELLKKYLHVWCSKLGYISNELAFVDTCAGAGVYGDGHDGSPLIAARWNEHPMLRKRGTRITVHAFETDPENAAALRQNLAPWLEMLPPRAHVYERSFFDDMGEVLFQTRSMPTLFFLDPFGITDITADRLRPLLNDKNRESTEVLVRADPTMLARFAGWLRRAKRTAADERYAESFKRLLQRLNVDTEGLTSADDMTEVGPTKHRLFAQYLQLFVDRFEYVQLVPVRANYWAEPKYFLIHGTDSPHGAAHINDVVSTTEDDLYTSTESRKDKESGQVTLFEPEREPPRYRRQQLQAAALAYLRNRGQAKFIEVRAELARLFGPDFREKDHKSVVRALVDNGDVGLATGDKLDQHSVLRAIKPPQ
jgi:three-Cys-motif partner protein